MAVRFLCLTCFFSLLCDVFVVFGVLYVLCVACEVFVVILLCVSVCDLFRIALYDCVCVRGVYCGMCIGLRCVVCLGFFVFCVCVVVCVLC